MFCRYQQWTAVRIRRNAFAFGIGLPGRRGRRPLRRMVGLCGFAGDWLYHPVNAARRDVGIAPYGNGARINCGAAILSTQREAPLIHR